MANDWTVAAAALSVSVSVPSPATDVLFLVQKIFQ